MTYDSRCLLNCSTGYSSSCGDGEHVCDHVSSDGTLIMWRSAEGKFKCVSIDECHACIVFVVSGLSLNIYTYVYRVGQIVLKLYMWKLISSHTV